MKAAQPKSISTMAAGRTFERKALLDQLSDWPPYVRLAQDILEDDLDILAYVVRRRGLFIEEAQNSIQSQYLAGATVTAIATSCGCKEGDIAPLVVGLAALRDEIRAQNDEIVARRAKSDWCKSTHLPRSVLVRAKSDKFRPIPADNVKTVFDDDRISDLATLSKFPADGSKKVFGRGIRETAGSYLAEVLYANHNDIYREVEDLHQATFKCDQVGFKLKPGESQAKFEARCRKNPSLKNAKKTALDHRCKKAFELVKRLSPQTRQFLSQRVRHPGVPLLTDPSPLLDPGRQAEAVERIAALCRKGGRVVKDRKRPGGKRSKRFAPELYAPPATQGSETREAEHNFLMGLRLAWLEATGEHQKSHTAKWVNRADIKATAPFVRFVRKCLKLVGVSDVNVIELINENRRRKLADLPRRLRQEEHHLAETEAQILRQTDVINELAVDQEGTEAIKQAEELLEKMRDAYKVQVDGRDRIKQELATRASRPDPRLRFIRCQDSRRLNGKKSRRGQLISRAAPY